MTPTSTWQRGFPIEPGYYWFYGYIFGRPMLDEHPRLEQFQVRKISNGLAYFMQAAFLNERDMIGFWMKNLEPDTTGLDEQLPKPPE